MLYAYVTSCPRPLGTQWQFSIHAHIEYVRTYIYMVEHTFTCDIISWERRRPECGGHSFLNEWTSITGAGDDGDDQGDMLRADEHGRRGLREHRTGSHGHRGLAATAQASHWSLGATRQ